MVSEQLDAVRSRHDIIVDGPFASNELFLALLAALQPGQRVLASDLRDGTAAGAACLALMRDGALPHVSLNVTGVAPADIPGLHDYRAGWRSNAYANTN
jgi:glycerol kinase